MPPNRNRIESSLPDFPSSFKAGTLDLQLGMSILEYRVLGTGSVFMIRFISEERLRVINLFRCCL